MSRVADAPVRPLLPELVRFVKAQASSGTATAIDWALLTLLIALRVHYLLAVLAGALAGAVTDFSLKRYWAFRSHAAPMAGEVGRYVLVSGASAGLNCALAYLGVDILGAPKVPGAILASVVVGVLWNYPMHRLFVFGRLAREGR